MSLFYPVTVQYILIIAILFLYTYIKILESSVDVFIAIVHIADVPLPFEINICGLKKVGICPTEILSLK